MIRIAYVDPDSQREVHVDFEGEHIRVGREGTNELVLPYMEVSRYHAELHVSGETITLVDRSTNGTFVNGERVFGRLVIQPGDRIAIGNCLVTCYTERQVREAEAAYYAQMQQQAAGGGAPGAQASMPGGGQVVHSGGQTTNLPAVPAQAQNLLGPHVPDQIAPGHAISAAPVDLKRRIHRRLLQYMDLKNLDMNRFQEDDLREKARSLLVDITAEMEHDIDPAVDRNLLIKEVIDEALGLGPLEDFLADESITEIMVVNKDKLYVERNGRIEFTGKTFTSHEAVLAVIERIITPLGRRIDESSPLVDARLKDGSRVNAIIPPLAIQGPCITIRKFGKKKMTVQDLVNFGSMTPQIAGFLEKCVLGHKNIIISGGTGSGKTTLLNVLSSFIPGHERIITIEDAAELRLHQEHVVSLETRPPNLEGKGAYAIRDLVKNSLRMRPDRIIVGECRGGEALDMLQAMNTGHDGSLTTGHANTPEDMISRMETMTLMAGMDLPVKAIREQIASALHVVVQQNRFPDGSRRITHVTEVIGLDDNGRVELEDIFRYQQRGTDGEGKIKGEMIMTGYIPSFMADLINAGVIQEGDFL